MSKQFEDKPYPNEVEGTKYLVTNAMCANGYTNGDIVILDQNKGRSSLYGINPLGDSVCIYWKELSPYEEPIESQDEPTQDTSDYDRLSLENHNLKQDIKKLEDYILRTARV